MRKKKIKASQKTQSNIKIKGGEKLVKKKTAWKGKSKEKDFSENNFSEFKRKKREKDLCRKEVDEKSFIKNKNDEDV